MRIPLKMAANMASPIRLGRVWPLRAWSLVGVIVLAAALACSSGTDGAGTSTPLPAGPEYSALVVTTDLSLGENRVVFGILDREGMPLRAQEAAVEAIFIPSAQAQGTVQDVATARFIQWPVGEQGVFSATLNLNQVGECAAQSAGCWALRVRTTGPDGAPVTAVAYFPVRTQSNSPGIGGTVPASVTLKGEDVDDLATITSSAVPDPDLYRLSVHEALAEDKPLVVTFATPAFCVAAVCGPQVEVVSQLKERIGDQANFIHVEVFKDPHLIEGGRPSGGFVPSVTEWNLPTEPWTFIVDKDGLLHSKFEAFTALEELEDSLRELISG